jgi:hypothetical protein
MISIVAINNFTRAKELVSLKFVLAKKHSPESFTFWSSVSPASVGKSPHNPRQFTCYIITKSHDLLEDRHSSLFYVLPVRPQGEQGHISS